MVPFEQIVNTLKLDVIVPNVPLKFPTQDIDHSPWLEKLRSEGIERKRAFFDEFLEFFFLLHLEQLGEAPIDPAHPSFSLLSFLAHTQISYDATYISPASNSAPSATLLGTPPRTTSIKPSAGKGDRHVPPRIFPMNTPNPTPLSTERDLRYVRAEGVTLASGMWGEEPDPVKERLVGARDTFALLWDKTAGVWVTVYRMCVNVAFPRLPSRDPLLCLTASITVRERPVPMTPARSVLAAMLAEVGGLPQFPTPARPDSPNDAHKRDKFYHGLDEVNLLEGLSSAPSFVHTPSPLSLPSTRIGARTRKQEFSLRFDSTLVDASVRAPSLATHATLRKSFRRTLSAVSAFRVRMRTVFVPYILLDAPDHDPGLDDALAAGHAEHTVMLCVELEHPGEAPEGFSVDAVDVTVGGGGGARVRLLPWGSTSLPGAFPLRLGVHEQYNLLFAVELLSAPVSEKGTLLGVSTASLEEELQRPVTITVRGRPFCGVPIHGDESGTNTEKEEGLLFPTQPFISRWNCVLDLAPRRHTAAAQTDSEVLPEPPSPFPTSTPRISTYIADQQDQSNPVAGTKRFTAPSKLGSRSPYPFHTFLVTTGALGASGSGPPSSGPLSKLAYTYPHVTTVKSGAPHTTYAPPPSPGIPPPASLNKMLPMGETDEAFMNGSGRTTPPPPTPAYPAYSTGSPVPATPRSQGPLAPWGAARFPGTAVGPPRSGTLPRPSPVALVPSVSAVPEHERIVVSVGLQRDKGSGAKVLMPHDEFALDIFVFNQSAWTRRFEVSFLERRRRRQGHTRGQEQEDGAAMSAGPTGGGGSGTASGPGIVPLESRVRVGPLRPATCQSVRMTFLALAPGVHTIKALMLTDTETRHALTLMTAMDVVVYENRPLG